MISYTIPAFASYLIIIAAVLIMTISTTKFLKGDFKNILKWLLFGFWFMAIPYTLFIVREMTLTTVDVRISWAIYIFMVVTGLCILKASILLYKFSLVYGFADVKENKR